MTFEHWLQSRLTSHGFPCGVIDGRLGPLTTAALRAFQASRGLPETGTATADTIAALRLPSSQNVGIRPVGEPSPAAPGPSPWPRQADCERFYGAVGTRQTRVSLPFPMRLAWALDTLVTRITLHELVAESAARAFESIAETYSPGERVALGLDRFGGSLNVRRMRGGSAWSMHSWGIAIDFDPSRNGLHTKAPEARLSHPDAVPFWEAWEREGWVSLGRQRNFDWMHVQAAQL